MECVLVSLRAVVFLSIELFSHVCSGFGSVSILSFVNVMGIVASIERGVLGLIVALEVRFHVQGASILVMVGLLLSTVISSWVVVSVHVFGVGQVVSVSGLRGAIVSRKEPDRDAFWLV